MTSGVNREVVVSAKKKDELAAALNEHGAVLEWRKKKSGGDGNRGFIALGKPVVLRTEKDGGGNSVQFCAKATAAVMKTKDGIKLQSFGITLFRKRHIEEEDEDRYAGAMYLRPEEFREVVKEPTPAIAELGVLAKAMLPKVQEAIAAYNTKVAA
jgi:hypothetical protein